MDHKKAIIAIVLTATVGVLLLQLFRGRNKSSVPGMVLVGTGDLLTTRPNTDVPIKVRVPRFLMDENLVTVGEFDAFVKATGYQTEAQRFGNAGVFVEAAHAWMIRDGVDYLYPQGRDKAPAPLDHPVTQVSWNDAVAYATWKGKRLPTQWEWELAAKSSSDASQYSWGDDLVVGGKYKANTWQGSFPYVNTVDDGFRYTSPVGFFGVNALGLTDMGGNVWQWCQDDIMPTEREAQVDPAQRKVLRGGSFLCEPGVCHGYRVTGRASTTAESSMMHIGFRCAKSI
jgi:sulfatase modifying factor 1